MLISLYAKGLTTGEIQTHLEEIYATTVSRESISKITDEILADMVAWQNRDPHAAGTQTADQPPGAERRWVCVPQRRDRARTLPVHGRDHTRLARQR